MSCDHCNKEFPEWLCRTCMDAIYCGSECYKAHHECIGRRAGGGPGRSAKFHKVMREFKEGKLHSGSKHGPVVTSREQALAIAFAEERKSNH
jgi:hypothetical protein